MYVYATDLGFPAQNSSNEAKVIVRVTRNVHAPKFERDLYTKSVLETIPVDSSVIKLNANDRDSAVSYSLSHSCILFDLGNFVIVCMFSCAHGFVCIITYLYINVHSQESIHVICFLFWCVCSCVCLFVCVCAWL